LAALKYWEIIADNLHKAGWSLGWISTLAVEGRTIWIVDAHGYGKRFIVRADEIPTAFLELERAVHEFAVDLMASAAQTNLTKSLAEIGRSRNSIDSPCRRLPE